MRVLHTRARSICHFTQTYLEVADYRLSPENPKRALQGKKRRCHPWGRMASPDSRIWSECGLGRGPRIRLNAATKGVWPSLSIDTPTVVDSKAANVPAVKRRGFQVLVFDGAPYDHDA